MSRAIINKVNLNKKDGEKQNSTTGKYEENNIQQQWAHLFPSWSIIPRNQLIRRVKRNV